MKKALAQLVKKLLDSKLVKNFIVQALIKNIGAASGFGGWLISKALFYLYDLANKYLRREVVKVETSEQVKEELKVYEKTINNPNATAEEIRNAGKKFLEQ
jgi:hypothetical protein